MMQLEVGGKHSMARYTLATKECYYYRTGLRLSLIKYVCGARGSNDGEDVAVGACWEVRHITRHTLSC